MPNNSKIGDSTPATAQIMYRASTNDLPGNIQKLFQDRDAYCEYKQRLLINYISQK